MNTPKTRILFALVAVLGLLGIAASFILSLEKIAILENPAVDLSCNIDEVFNCASVMKSEEAELFGFPNQFMGLVGYAMIFTFAFLSIFTEKVWNKFILSVAFLGSFASFAFSYWLIFHSIFTIKILCIYCLLSCFAATNIFFLIKILCLKQNLFGFGESAQRKIESFIAKKWYLPFIVLWHLAIVGLVVSRFYYI